MTKPSNITEVWNRSHAHLQPIHNHLALSPQDKFDCPHCGGTDAFQLRVRLRFGEMQWVENGQPLYCPDCLQYTLLDTHISNETVTAVDARLWSANPSFLNIEPTTRCNFNCWYCVGRQLKQQDICIDDFSKALNNFPSVKTIALVGEGEPLLHKDFFTMAKMAKERGIRVVIISNGSGFSESVVKKLCEAEIVYVGVSIDSANPATFASSRIDGNLQKIWEGIERLRRFRDDNGYRYPKIGLKGTLFNHSQDEIPSIVTEAKKHGVEIFESFQPLNPMRTYLPIYPSEGAREIQHINRVAQSIARDSALAIEQLESAFDFFQGEGIEINNSGTSNGLRKNCDQQWIYSLLTGDITPCCQIKTPIDKQFNLYHHSIGQIIANPHYENIRFNLWNGLFPSYCEGCSKTC